MNLMAKPRNICFVFGADDTQMYMVLTKLWSVFVKEDNNIMYSKSDLHRYEADNFVSLSSRLRYQINLDALTLWKYFGVLN